ncbi:phage baseplate assembly protein V [Streptomyces sp. NBC_01445]|uniref:phage baseplate assembly protein V n=1 Tax=Streptomyces sp. NBC_01445 TaxID=2903869 RepID=UPI002DD9A1F2|nr:phage baseplate assembly protein V [Streptomyces sp. NBC_01445]WSE03777.1 phage baseplate assembly protein V [Streptomyces sp. NBC_01445]
MQSDELSRHVGRYYGKYRGKVVDNRDDLHRGTLQVTVPDVFGPTADVPAVPCLPYGQFFVPPVGTDVWVEFEAGDTTRAVWAGVWYPDGTAPEEARVSPPRHRVIQTEAGHTIEIVDTEGEERILIRHATDAFVSIDHDGSVLLANRQGSHLHLDAAERTTTLVEEHGNHLVMGESGTAFVNPKGTTLNLAGDTVHLSADTVVLDATHVAVGTGAGQPTILGTAFTALWNKMLNHTHPAPGGATTASAELKLLPLDDAVHLTSSVVVK